MFMARSRERRRVDGTRAYAVLWRDPDTGRQTSLTYDDKRDATVACELIEAAGGHALEADRIAEGIRKTGPSVDDVISEHIDLLTSVGPDTRKHYRRQLEAHISPSLGPYPVAAMTYRHIAGWVREMDDKGLALKTIANVHGLFSAAMTTAVRLGDREGNPCAGVELPKSRATHDEMTVLTRDEFALLLSKVSPFYQPLVITLVATGPRWGEATALTVSDFDLTATPPTLRVTKAWKRDAERTGTSGRRRRGGHDAPWPCPTIWSTCSGLSLPTRRHGTWSSPTRSGRSCRHRGSGHRRGLRHSTPRPRRCSPTGVRTLLPRGSRSGPVLTTSDTRMPRG